MNVHVETNFVLELVFQQEQAASCEEILALAVAGDLHLMIPAYSMVEPWEKLIRQRNSRRITQQSMEIELKQLARTSSYQTQLLDIQNIYDLLLHSSDDEAEKLAFYRKVLLENAVILPLTSEVLTTAAECETRLNLQPQDAVVYASTLNHLQQQSAGQLSCFINRNSRDFGPKIKLELALQQCLLIYNFSQGLDYIRSVL